MDIFELGVEDSWEYILCASRQNEESVGLGKLQSQAIDRLLSREPLFLDPHSERSGKSGDAGSKQAPFSNGPHMS